MEPGIDRVQAKSRRFKGDMQFFLPHYFTPNYGLKRHQTDTNDDKYKLRAIKHFILSI